MALNPFRSPFPFFPTKPSDGGRETQSRKSRSGSWRRVQVVGKSVRVSWKGEGGNGWQLGPTSAAEGKDFKLIRKQGR